jgi:hypothetical protein
VDQLLILVLIVALTAACLAPTPHGEPTQERSA